MRVKERIDEVSDTPRLITILGGEVGLELQIIEVREKKRKIN